MIKQIKATVHFKFVEVLQYILKTMIMDCMFIYIMHLSLEDNLLT